MGTRYSQPYKEGFLVPVTLKKLSKLLLLTISTGNIHKNRVLKMLNSHIKLCFSQCTKAGKVRLSSGKPVVQLAGRPN